MEPKFLFKTFNIGAWLAVIGIVVAVGIIYLWMNYSPSYTKMRCGIENCHGLDITCGPNIPKQCTEEYQFGDRCRKYASCTIVEGQCLPSLSDKFFRCRECVYECKKKYADNYVLLSDCEINCGLEKP